jgi:hypothetical protein
MQSSEQGYIFYIKGFNYRGGCFSFKFNKSVVTVFSRVAPGDIVKYAIAKNERDKILVSKCESINIQFSFDEFCQDMANDMNGRMGGGCFVQIVIKACVRANFEQTQKATCYTVKKEEVGGPTIHYAERCGYAVGLCDEVDFIDVKGMAESECSKILSMMVMSGDDVFGIEKKHGYFFINHCGKDVYVFSPTFRCEGYSLKNIDAPEIFLDFFGGDEVYSYIDSSLLVQGLGCSANTSYVQFMSIWIVLEKCISKYYKSIGRQVLMAEAVENISLLNKRTKDLVVELKSSLENSSVEKKLSSINIEDKFILCCAARGVQNMLSLLDSFKQVKERRDKLHHSVSESSIYPVKTVLQILRVFVKGRPLPRVNSFVDISSS